MSWNNRRIGAIAIAIVLVLTFASAPAGAQFYGGGYWGGGGGQTVAGNQLRGAGYYAMGAGQYNVQTAQARSINAQTAMQWNQYMYNSRVQAAQIYRARDARLQGKEKADYNAIHQRVRNNPNAIDVSTGNALNAALDELTDPKVYPKAVDYGHKIKVGGEAIRDIPFQYASEAISISVHQLTQGEPPAALRRDEFGPDRDKIKAITAELRQEGQELGTHKPETIKKAKDQIQATRAKVEATLDHNSQEYRDAEKYVKAMYGLASMLETPAVNVILAGVEKHPDATLGDLLGFMTAYNLRFGASTNDRQRQVYINLYPLLDRLRDDLVSGDGSTAATPGPVDNAAPVAAFEQMGNVPPPPNPR